MTVPYDEIVTIVWTIMYYYRSLFWRFVSLDCKYVVQHRCICLCNNSDLELFDNFCYLQHQILFFHMWHTFCLRYDFFSSFVRRMISIFWQSIISIACIDNERNHHGFLILIILKYFAMLLGHFYLRIVMIFPLPFLWFKFTFCSEWMEAIDKK